MSILCLIFSAILLFVGLLVFAGLLLWCETFQTNKRSKAAPAAPTTNHPEGDPEADTAAKAKAEEKAAQAKAEAEEKAVAAAVPASDETEAGETSDSDDSPAADKDGDGLPDIDTATPEQAAAAFREELDAGFARQEDDLGIIYNQRPDSVDDLKLIKGVARILEQKLHDSGIHRFKQIALWTDTAAREFGARLSFRDRIFRDDWIAQAKKFHDEKYGEKL